MSVSESGMPDLLADLGSTWSRQDLRFGANWVGSGDVADQETFLNSLTEGELLALPFLFEFWALEHQLPPDGDWRTWVILGGRGAGKTRAGSEWVRSMVEGARPLDHGRARRLALVGETVDQVREVMIFGESGILACTPPDRQPRWEATRKRLVWDNGAEARVFSAHDPEALRGPQFDAAWCDEFGCSAIDKGTNQPNKFLDPKSSESGLPHYSNGQRDEFLQRQYFKAMLKHWKDPYNNPHSEAYDGRMIDMDHAYAWAWDARPYPAFPNNQALWSDAENYFTGHWLNGRSSAKALSDVISEVCGKSGVDEVDATGAFGVVRGYLSDSGDTARSELQPLLMAYGVDAAEEGGQLRFSTRSGDDPFEVNPSTLVERAEQGDVERVRGAEVEEAGRVRVGFVEADGEFNAVWEDAAHPDERSEVVNMSELPLAMTRSEGRLVAERWLAEARVSRDRISFALPPSATQIGLGSVVRIGEGERYRVDRIEVADSRQIEAVRIDPEAYKLARIEDEPPIVTPFVAPVPVFPVFLDLPLIEGSEDPYSPFVAVTAKPWPGQVGVFKANATGAFELNASVSECATIGVTETVLARAEAGVVDRGAALQVKMASVVLDSAAWAAVLAGANRVAIGHESLDDWEVFQFADAELIASDTYLLRTRLRGLSGTDGIMPDAWPVGSKIVLLNEAVTQLILSPNNLAMSQDYRIGPLSRPLDDASFVEVSQAFPGTGLRPYRPCHLRQMGDDFGWTRRTRIGGDSWASVSQPMGEESEAYLVRIKSNGAIVRSETVSSAQFTYGAGERAADGVGADFVFEVAQISAEFGTGPFASISAGA